MERPEVRQTGNREWEFIYPDRYKSQELHQLFWDTVEQLDENPVEVEVVLKIIISEFPFHINAYNYLSLAFEQQGKLLESDMTAERAYKLAKACLPNELKRGGGNLSYYVLDNRPYFMACQLYGLNLQKNGELKAASAIYNEAIKLHKSDNLGLRFLLLECLFNLNNLKAVRRLLESSKEEYSTDILYGRVILELLSDQAELIPDLLQEAVSCNKFVPKYIRAKKVLKNPSRLNGYSPFGVTMRSEYEAYLYWERNSTILQDPKILAYFIKPQP